MKKIYISKKEKGLSAQTILFCSVAFLFGCVATASIILNLQADNILDDSVHGLPGPKCPSPVLRSLSESTVTSRSVNATKSDSAVVVETTTTKQQQQQQQQQPGDPHTILQNTRILVAIAAFDFSQIPHLEEVLDSYHDLCVTGATVDVVIHSTVAYPVTLIDLWNTRFPCSAFSLTIVLKPKSLRLHLVDCHRQLFYDRLEQYDLFIYTEDDIRVTPTTVAVYLAEMARLRRYLEQSSSSTHLGTNKKTKKPYHFTDFNIGIVRYEYNYPANVVIDDKTRHATQNVTRVYWEHSGFQRPVVPNAILTSVEQDKYLSTNYFTMKNHHQGMYLATRELLLAWKDRCEFHKAKNRPGRGSQPTEGTQRVWMSSQQMYGGRHCGIIQLLPKGRSFGALTVLHLPNKNYRRVGKYRKRVFSDGTEVFETPHSSLLTAVELHLGMREAWPPEPQIPYRGIKMVDEQGQKDRSPLLERRLADYQRYVDHGGVLSREDFAHTSLIEEK